MNHKELWYQERDDRLIRYAGRKLDPNRWIILEAEPDYLRTYEGQVAVLTAANLLGRISPSVAFNFPRIPMVSPLPWAGQDLLDYVLMINQESDPLGRYCVRGRRPEDYLIFLGSSGASQVIHGTGWFSYIGPSPSPLKNLESRNPVGPALAAVAAIAQLFVGDFPNLWTPCRLNAFNWSDNFTPDIPPPQNDQSFGNVWFVGAGSVGTAILYFLTLFTRNFCPTLIDNDIVQRHNITRSPIFAEKHVDLYKVDVAGEYLKGCGVKEVSTEACAFHKSPMMIRRKPGNPDLLVPAANEFNVRSQIESLYPPLQIYGTTGRNWQASMIRHIPGKDPCSNCLFPDDNFLSTECAVATDVQHMQEVGVQIDASLPFLSFAAGLMAVAEMLKFSIPGYPFGSNRAFFYTKPESKFNTAGSSLRSNCDCANRDKTIYNEILEGTLFKSFSE